MSSTTSNAPDERHLALLQAAARGQEARVQSLLSESLWQSRMDTWALRHSLQKAAARKTDVSSNLSLAQLLLDKGADINPELNEVSALIKAAEIGNAPLVELLLRSNKTTSGRATEVDVRDKNGRSALYAAARNGNLKVIQLLLGAGANIDARDKEGRTPLLHLAAEKSGQWETSTTELLLSLGADIEAEDNTKRTALLWAAATNKVELCKLLLSGSKANPANVHATNNRGKTALQMAAEQGYAGIVKALLDAGADPTLTSDGQWTALHNAAEKGHIGVVKLLLGSSHADVNAETSSGMTALHWAAQNGHREIVEMIIQKPDVLLAARDAFMSTPLLRAAERGHQDIVHMLSPYKMWDRLPHAAQQACRAMNATVVDFGVAPSEKNVEHRKGQLVNREQKIHELLYGWDTKNDKPAVSCLAKNIKSKPAFRWIHLPANNLDWVQTLVTKAFIEGGARDVDEFKALEKCFIQEHRGPTVHAHFMRTYCQRMGTTADKQAVRLSPANAQGPFASPSPAAAAAVEKLQAEGSSSDHTNSTPRKQSTGQKETLSKNQQRKAKRQAGQGKESQQQQSKADLTASLTSVRSRKDSWRPPSTPKPDPRFGDKHGKVVFFMPYLHYETDESRRKMSRVIRSTLKQDFQQFESRYQTADENLIDGYLTSSPQLHIRRTLDQFFYHGIDTKDRDEDQVVYRYCERLQKLGHKTEKKVFMVDQLWCFVLSSELIVTCFPQRWNQPKNDPLNVLDGIIEDINSKTRPPVTSVYDLAMLISSRCSSVFDQTRLGHEEYQFLDMFDTSIGVVTNRETKLFRRFNAASVAAARWLKLHRRARSSEDKITDAAFENKEHKHNTSFVDELLNIDTETELLAEVKDIRDELQMIDKVLKEQRHVIPDLADKLMEELGGRRTNAAVDVQRKSKEQLKIIETHIKDVDRMDLQAEGIYTSLTHLLDLKQKHANAFEARFARDQAELQAKQGQTIMVFTIVTIVFLPLSFMAAFFTINIEQFPKAAGGSNQLNLHWVSKYLFGIGLAISIPLIALAFSVHDIVAFFSDLRSGTMRTLFHRKPKADIDITVSPPEENDYPTGRISRSSNRRRRSDAYETTMNGEKINGRINHLSPIRKGLAAEDRERALDLSSERGFSPPTRQWSRRTEFSWRLDVRGRDSRDTDRLRYVV